MANDSEATKLLKSAFQATTLRTAGFSTIDQQELTTAGKFISIGYKNGRISTLTNKNNQFTCYGHCDKKKDTYYNIC